MLRRTTGAALTAAAMVAAIGAGTATAEARPRLHDGVDAFKVRPATVRVSGDGTGWLGGAGFGDVGRYGTIRWTRFRRSGARGDGRIFISDCEPDCAGGTMSNWKAVIRAERVRRGRFTRLSARYARDGRTITARWKLEAGSPKPRSGRDYHWLALPDRGAAAGTAAAPRSAGA